jgi:hypothetical protein
MRRIDQISFSRRKFIVRMAGVTSGMLPLNIQSAFAAEMLDRSRIKAIAFDAFPILALYLRWLNACSREGAQS